MANKVYDANRLKKVYPLIRVKPVLKQFLSEDFIFENSGINVETKIISFSDEYQKTYEFQESYTEIPVIALTPEDENVNIFVTSLSIDRMTIESSSNFTGKVHIQVFKAN